MSLIAGYYSFPNHDKHPRLIETAKSFSIDPTNSTHNYLFDHYEILSGEVIAKYIDIKPAQVQVIDADGLVVLLLGFHEMSCREMIAGVRDIPDPVKKTKILTSRIKHGEGDFVAVVLDRNQNQVHIINNRFAQRPFYYYPSVDGVYFSSNIVFLCRMLTEKIQIDPIGWLQIFTFSHTFHSKTNVRNLLRLSPASHLILSRNGMAQKRYWELRYEVDNDLNLTEHAEKVFKAFQDSCRFRAHLGPKKIVALSGGLDSRLVVGALPKDTTYHTLTFINSTEEAETLEVAAAREVSQILGVTHKVVELPQSAFNVADELIWLIGGLLPMHHSVKSWQIHLEMKRTGRYGMGGGPGDVMAGSYINSIFQIGKLNRNKILSDYFKNRCRFSPLELQHVFSTEFIQEYWSLFLDSVKQSYCGLTGETAAHTITAWAMMCRQPAFTYTSAIHTLPDIMGASPHLGYEYNDLMLKLPASWLYKKNFYHYMIYHCLPELRSVIYANTGKPVSGKFCNYKNQLLRERITLLRKRVTSPVWRTLNTAGLIHQKKKPLSNYHYEYFLIQKDTNVLNQLTEIIHSIQEIRDLVNVEGCDAFIKHYKNSQLVTASRANDAEMMGALISLCFWYKLWYG